MNELDLIELRIRLLNALLLKKTERYHDVTLRGDLEKRHEIHQQCFDLRRAIDRLEFDRKRTGGCNE